MNSSSQVITVFRVILTSKKMTLKRDFSQTTKSSSLTSYGKRNWHGTMFFTLGETQWLK